MGTICLGVERLSLPILMRAHRLISARMDRLAIASDGDDPRLETMADMALQLAGEICRRARSLDDVRAIAQHFARRGEPHNDFEGSRLAMVLVRSMAEA
jgi:hypothetical protein